MNVTQRFLKYISVDTTSDPSSTSFPSTQSQLSFADMLVEELKDMGAQQVKKDQYGYVYAKIPSTIPDYKGTVIGFLSHMDTSPDASGKNINPRIITDYDGAPILLNDSKNLILKPEDFPVLKDYVGQTLIVTDGTTLLGGDDKAGVAEIMTAASYLLSHPEIPHGPIALAFTPDEEVGQGVDYFNVEEFGADFAYTMDGGVLGELEYENFNAASAVLEICGLSIHPGTAKNMMKNALLMGMEFEQMMPRAQKPEHTEGYEGFIHLTDMHGSVEKAVMEYIIRDHDAGFFQEKKLCMEKAAAYLNEKYGKGSFTLTIEDSYYNMKEQILPHMHLIDHVLKAFETLDIVPRVQPIRGGTDGSRLSFMGVPCPNLGVGDHNCHGPYEFVCAESMEKAVQLIIELSKLYAQWEKPEK